MTSARITLTVTAQDGTDHTYTRTAKRPTALSAATNDMRSCAEILAETEGTLRTTLDVHLGTERIIHDVYLNRTKK